MTQTPTLNGQDIGRAQKAIGAVLDRLLAETGTTFRSWVILNVLAANGPALDQEELVGRVAVGLKIDELTVRADLAELASQGLISSAPSSATSPVSALTPAGSTRVGQVQEGIAAITQRLYGGLPAEDLITARRVLAAVTDRANAELAH
jgi:DNA-binding MarR family transcriptional regulator